MRRTALLGALLVTVLACTLAISTPQPVQALQCCVGTYYTQQYWTKAPTCSEAQTAYRNLARQEADAVCGGSLTSCALSIPPCENWYNEDPANPWKLDGIASFGCKEYCERDPYVY
jgi:hypothetical protein